MTIGDIHGGAGTACSRMLQEALQKGRNGHENDLSTLAEKIVKEHRENSKRIPGFGHRDYKKTDPRADKLLIIAKETGVYGQHCTLVEGIRRCLQKGRKVPPVLNLDGAHGAILSDMGFHWKTSQAVFLIGRCAGLCAHVQEEMETGIPMGFSSEIRPETVYTGSNPDERSGDDGTE